MPLSGCFGRMVGLPKWQSGKEFYLSVQSKQDVSLIHGLERSPGVGNSNGLQYSCLGNLMGRGAWCATVHGVAKNQTRLSMHMCTLGEGGSKTLP